MAKGSKKKAAPTQRCLGFYPMLSKTAVAIGKFASVPGEFWDKCPVADKKKRYLCTVSEFVALHDFGAGTKGAGFEVKEMGEDGKGSLEPGVASGDVFVVGYPMTFLEYYWFANRAELEPAVRLKLYPPVTDGAGGSSIAEANDDGDAEDEEKVDVKKEIERLPIFDHMARVSSTLVTAGPKRGSYINKYTCAVMLAGGACGCSITLYASGDGKAETTSNAWKHTREKAEKGCAAHAAVLKELNQTNKNMVETADGELVRVMSFEEAFPHHVDYVWCRARGIFGAKTGSKPLFRKYVRGYEPRAVFPHTEVQYNIALCIKELQDEEQLARLTALQKEFKMGPCIGLQLDMWTNTHTHISYAGVNAVTVREPTMVFTAGSTGVSKAAKKEKQPQLWASGEVLDFDVFPSTEHTGVAIRDWFGNVLEKKAIKISCTSSATPDGAADGQCGLAMVDGMGEKVDTCNLHGLQRSVQYSMGLAGTGSTAKNPEGKALIKGHHRTGDDLIPRCA